VKEGGGYMNKLNVKALGLAFGIVWSAGIFLPGIGGVLVAWLYNKLA